MAGTVPAERPVDLPAPTQPSDLDGWDANDLEGWLPPAIAATVAAEERTNEMRASCGLVLYRLRGELGDGPYGEALDRVASASKVTVRTLTNWRRLAEKQFQLSAPTKRAAGVRKQRETAKTKQRLETVSRDAASDRKAPPQAGKIGAGTDDTPASEAQPTPRLGPDGSTDGVSGASPSPDGSASTRGTQEPPPLPQPRTKEDFARLVSLIETAGPVVLSKSVARAQLMKAQRTIAEALRLAPAAPLSSSKSAERDFTPNFKKSMKGGK